ncbi:hypothetical protein [Nitrosopumilus adriaticus]|uniref:Uncharacterized protein n=1 Tax=Nitrosopumilus adriaticus TaxID=1580092 RepID=A0A0D5C2L1_9ARCH|nr:hypothetical protein [Nitrosopumilus adriaticus]AJW71039.1 hypothetical protein NADRNF5_1353 [Nitrosopumilus adriaticus]
MINDKKKLLEQLEALKLFPNNNLVKQLRKQIKTKLKQLDIKKSKPEISISEKHAIANANRSAKVKRTWNYVKQIQKNFPNLTIKEIRSQLKVRAQGQKTSIPDAIWQNPSP